MENNFNIVIPAYNASDYLVELISRIQEVCSYPIIIIDDGSAIPVSTLELPENIIIIRNSDNIGKGYCLHTGFKIARENGASHVITIDADLQHNAERIPEFAAIDSEIDLIIGKRFFGKTMPFHRRLSNSLTSLIVSLLCLRRVYDSQCGYRRYKLTAIEGFEFKEFGFMFETEILLKIIGTNKGSLGFVDIETIYDLEKSFIKNFRNTIEFIFLIFKHLFGKD